MNELDDLARRLHAQRKKSTRRREAASSDVPALAARMGERHVEYRKRVAWCLRQVLLPRFELLAASFPGVTLEGPSRRRGDAVRLRLLPTTEVPTEIDCEVLLAHDTWVERILAFQWLRVRPLFVSVQAGSDFSAPLATFDEKRFCQWADECILGFDAARLKLAYGEQAQRRWLSTDLVSGVRISTQSAVSQAQYAGRTFYFVSLANRDEFMKNPERYLASPEE